MNNQHKPMQGSLILYFLQYCQYDPTNTKIFFHENSLLPFRIVALRLKDVLIATLIKSLKGR